MWYFCIIFIPTRAIFVAIDILFHLIFDSNMSDFAVCVEQKKKRKREANKYQIKNALLANTNLYT